MGEDRERDMNEGGRDEKRKNEKREEEMKRGRMNRHTAHMRQKESKRGVEGGRKREKEKERANLRVSGVETESPLYSRGCRVEVDPGGF